MIQRKKHFTLEDHTIVSSHLFCSLVYRNWQRPGAAINLTTDEAAGAVERDGHLIIHSWKHKTVLADGPAVMALHPDDVAIFLHYRDGMRPPNVAAGSSAGGGNIFLPNLHNRSLTNYSTRKFNHHSLSTATAVRKAGATKMVGSNYQLPSTKYPKLKNSMLHVVLWRTYYTIL